jgi:hypothetical protein
LSSAVQSELADELFEEEDLMKQIDEINRDIDGQEEEEKISHRVSQNIGFSKFKRMGGQEGEEKTDTTSPARKGKNLQSKNTGDFSPLTPSKTTGVRIGVSGFEGHGDPSRRGDQSPSSGR